MITPDQDRRDRWLPAAEAVQHSVELLNTEPAADMAIIPMYQPGKQRAIWVIGQEVRTVMGVVFLATDSDKPCGRVRSYRDACNAARLRAHIALSAQPGTTAYAVVDRDGHVDVFEDV